MALGLLMQLAGSLGGIDPIRPLLLTTPFETWHGLLAQPHFLTPLLTGLIVNAVWSVITLGAAFLTLRRRDITED